MPIPLQTYVNISPSKVKIDHRTPALFIGSCFSDNIGTKLQRLKFPVQLNPFGVLYNPLSIARALNRIIDCQYETDDNLMRHNNLWFSFDFHGSFSNASNKLALNNMNQAIDQAHRFLRDAKFLIVTFGTAWVYRYQHTGNIVANCHKLSDKQFDRYKLTINDITSTWAELVDKIKKINPTINIVFTVSPVRHLKDGANGNQLSKATLHLAIDQIISNIGQHQTAHYFPAYELVNDELRDYRFYSTDMIHLNDVGIHYIFEKFSSCYFSKETEKTIREIEAVIIASEHRVMNSNPLVLKKFASDQLNKIESIISLYPYLDFSKETKHFKELLNQ